MKGRPQQALDAINSALMEKRVITFRVLWGSQFKTITVHGRHDGHHDVDTGLGARGPNGYALDIALKYGRITDISPDENSSYYGMTVERRNLPVAVDIIKGFPIIRVGDSATREGDEIMLADVLSTGQSITLERYTKWLFNIRSRKAARADAPAAAARARKAIARTSGSWRAE